MAGKLRITAPHTHTRGHVLCDEDHPRLLFVSVDPIVMKSTDVRVLQRDQMIVNLTAREVQINELTP